MGFVARSLASLALVLVPAVAAAQAGPPPPGGSPPPPGGGGAGPARAEPAPPPDPGSGGAKPAADDPKAPKDVGGYAYSDKPVKRATTARRLPRRAGPQATFPGFEQLPDGGSRLFVQLSQTVPVEERRAQGSITYVLKGAHARVFNDTNSLVTVHFNTPVASARLVPQGNDVLFVVALRATASPTFKVQDNQDKTSTLMIDFPKGDFGGGGEGLETGTGEPPPPKALRPTKITKTSGRKAAPPPPPAGAPPPAPPPETKAADPKP